MKKFGGHPHKALTAVRVNSLSTPGRYADGNGLYLIVDPSGAKRWVLRTVVHGRRRDIGLGGLRLVSLAEARDKAAAYRKLARDGENPLEARRRANAIVPTFADAAKRAYEQHKSAWKNEKHSSQWINTLTAYVFPLIGEKRVDEIETADIHRVLTPIWLSKPETARRIRQRIKVVLDWAKAAGFRAGENPSDGVTKGLPRQPDRKNHFGAIPYVDVPDFVRLLGSAQSSEPAKLAFEFLILTATRTNEVLGAHWSEVDLDKCTWTIPAGRMKAGRDHRIPLVGRMVVGRQDRVVEMDGHVASPESNQSFSRPVAHHFGYSVLATKGRLDSSDNISSPISQIKRHLSKVVNWAQRHDVADLPAAVDWGWMLFEIHPV